MEALVERFLGDLDIRNFSQFTLSGYRSNLEHLKTFLKERGIETPAMATAYVMAEFQRWVFSRPVYKHFVLQVGAQRSVANQNRILIQAKAFFAFLQKEGYLLKNPMEEVEYAREPTTLPKNILTPEEAQKIIEVVDVSNPLGYRDRTILEVFYATGIRSRELINLCVENINLEEELLRVNSGKCAKDRVVPLSKIACRFLETYIKGVRPELGIRNVKLGMKNGKSEGGAEMRNDFNRLFLSNRGKPLDPFNLGKMVKKYARLAGVAKRVTCHVWRHSCATHLLKNRANLRHVQEILGHRSLATTERYLHLTITDLKAAHSMYHPREKECLS